MPEPTQLTIHGDAEPLRPAGAPDECAVCEREGRACTYCTTVAFGAKLAARDAPLFTAPQTMRGQLAMPTDRAPGPADQTGKLVGPCDHPDYALSQDLPYGDGRTYCTLCGAKAG